MISTHVGGLTKRVSRLRTLHHRAADSSVASVHNILQFSAAVDAAAVPPFRSFSLAFLAQSQYVRSTSTSSAVFGKVPKFAGAPRTPMDGRTDFLTGKHCRSKRVSNMLGKGMSPPRLMLPPSVTHGGRSMAGTNFPGHARNLAIEVINVTMTPLCKSCSAGRKMEGRCLPSSRLSASFLPSFLPSFASPPV